MGRPMSVQDHITEINYVVRAVGECQEDLATAKAGNGPVIYNIDFGLLCPVLFKSPGQGSSPFMVSAAAATRTVLEKGAGHHAFRIVMSGLTLLEFFDQLNHTLSSIQRASLRIPEYATFDESQMRDTLMSSDQLRARLLAFTRRGLDAQVRQPINKIMGYLESGSVVGIADVLDVAAVRKATDTAQFRELFAQQLALRSQNDRRKPEDSAFHYKIDAANICLTLAAARADGVPAYFVTTTPLNLRQLHVGGRTFARMNATPQYLINLESLKRKGVIDDEQLFLERAARRGLELADDLRKRESLEKAPADVQIELVNFFGNYHRRLSATTRAEREAMEADLEEIMRVVRDPKRVRDLISEATDDLRDGARRLEDYSEQLDLGYVHEFDFENDPVLERVRRNLGIMKST